MIIVDLTQVLIASLMASTRGGQEPISEDLVRHIALKSLAMYRKKYKNKYGELVLADDSYNVWRKDVFPHYKANRKKTRDKDTKDWNQIFDCISVIREELKYNFPNKYIYISKSEADDIIDSINKHRLTQILEQCKEFEESLTASKQELRGLKTKEKQAHKKIEMLHDHEYDPDCKYCCDNKFVKDATKA